MSDATNTREDLARKLENAARLGGYIGPDDLRKAASNLRQMQADALEHAEAAEARERAKDEALKCIKTSVANAGFFAMDLRKALVQIDRAATSALAQQPADQPAQEWSVDQAKAYIDQFDADQPAQEGDGIKIIDAGREYIVKVNGEAFETHSTLHDAKEGWNRAAMTRPNAPRHIGIYREASADQTAQGERLDPHTLERAAQVVLEQGFRTSPAKKAQTIRNLRDGDDT